MILPVDPSRYAAFVVVMTVMAVTPGPANLFAIATGMEKGRGAALLGVLGMNMATLVWFVAASVGLGALIVAFPVLFRGLAWAGAAYLVWLGFKALRGALKAEAAAPSMLMRLGRSALRDGFMVQIVNPKVVVFFGAVLPPFVDMQRALAPQFALLALGTLGMDALAMTAYGLGGAAVAHRMGEPRFRRAFGLFVGVLLICAAGLIVSRA